MANVKQYNELMQALKRGEYKPVYLLHGEEPYYIDKVSRYIEKNAIEEHERDFNLNVLYGRDLTKDLLIETARRFPMMAQRQVVIVREAQDFDGRWADLLNYFENPMESTVLVIDLKYKAADTKTKWCSAIAEKGVVFASTRHYDNELPGVVEGFVKALKYHINPQASNMMAEYLGNDLEKIEKEIEKLTITIPLSKEISTDDVHRLIGVSKEYNIFEYANALGARDALKSYKIAQFLGRNEKNNPMVLIIGTLYSQFSKVMMLHSLKSKDTASISRELGLRGDYFARQYIEIARKFDQRKAAEIISILREFDARSKGVESVSESSEDMLKELTFRILK